MVGTAFLWREACYSLSAALVPPNIVGSPLKLKKLEVTVTGFRQRRAHGRCMHGTKLVITGTGMTENPRGSSTFSVIYFLAGLVIIHSLIQTSKY